MDDFIIVLAIALVLLGAFILVSGPLITPPPTKAATNVSTITSVTVGPVGYVSSIPSKIVEIKSFSAGTAQQDIVKEWPSQEITGGLFDNKQISESVTLNKNTLEISEKITLEFDVNKEKTNSAEDLVVEWNGVPVYKNKPTEGHQAVKIPKENSTDSNSLKIYTSAPGASSLVQSTLYSLEKIKIIQETGQSRIETLELNSSDLDVLEKAEISLTAIPRSEPVGKLKIKVNGIELYNKAPERFVLLRFDTRNVPNLGTTNKISFLSEGGLIDVQNAKINVYLLSTTVVKKRSFLLTADQISNIEKKKLKLEVDVSQKKGGRLTVNLNGNMYEFSSLQEGKNVKEITRTDLLEGENKVEFTGTGSFEIPEARILAE